MAFSRFISQPFNAGEVAGIPHLVKVEHRGAARAQQPPDHGAADEASAAGHQDPMAPLEQGGKRVRGVGGVGHGKRNSRI